MDAIRLQRAHGYAAEVLHDRVPAELAVARFHDAGQSRVVPQAWRSGWWPGDGSGFAADGRGPRCGDTWNGFDTRDMLSRCRQLHVAALRGGGNVGSGRRVGGAQGTPRTR